MLSSSNGLRSHPGYDNLKNPHLAAALSLVLKISETKINMASSISTLAPNPLPNICSHAHLSPHLSQMGLLRSLNLNRRFNAVSASIKQDTTLWTQAPLVKVKPAAESLFHIGIDVSESPELCASYARAGQYLQLRIGDFPKPSFLAIASPPSLAKEKGVFEFLVKSVPGSTAEALCGLEEGDVVELTKAMGGGFDLDRISPPEEHPVIFIFATGSGISPIRSLIESGSGFGADKRSDVRLYYGARNLRRMAYQDRFNDWESSGVKIVPVLSQPDSSWEGESGFVQAAFAKAKCIFKPQGTGAVLCGQKQMTEEVTSLLVGYGVSAEKILKNF